MKGFAFRGIETVKVLFVCCNGDCRRDEEKILIKAIESKGNIAARASQFVISEHVNFSKSKVEVKRTYFATQSRLDDDIKGRKYGKVETCSHVELTQRQEAIIAMRLAI